MLKATVNGLQRLRRPAEVAQTRGLTISQVLPVGKPPAEPEAPPEAPEAPSEDTDGQAEDHPDT
jgi:hypothetical protein